VEGGGVWNFQRNSPVCAIEAEKRAVGVVVEPWRDTKGLWSAEEGGGGEEGIEVFVAALSTCQIFLPGCRRRRRRGMA